MIQLLDIKSSKEKYLTELEGLRSEIAKEKSVMMTLKSCSAPVPALDLTSPATVSGEAGEMEAPLPSLAPALRRDVRHRPDYYRQMFEPSASKVPRLCEGKNREYNNPLYSGGYQPNTHQPHHPPMMHYMGHHTQPVNFSRAMEQDMQDKARIAPPGNLQQMPAVFKPGPQEPARQPAPAAHFPLHGPHSKAADFLMAARPEPLYGRTRHMALPLLPPPGLETESKCEACGTPANFMCSACKLVHYCSAACQKGHWSLHGRSCRK